MDPTATVRSKPGRRGVHLLTEFLEEREVVGGVGLVRIFPVEIDAVEEAWDGDARCELALEEGVDAGGDEGLAVCGLGVVSKIGGVAFEGYEDAKVWELLLEKLELMKIAAEGLGWSVRRTVNTVFSGERVVEVGVGVGYGTAVIGDESLGVVDLVDERSVAVGEIFHQILRLIVDAPLREVADE